MAVPLLLMGLFLGFYLQWRAEDRERFKLEGPGALAEAGSYSYISWHPKARDQKTRGYIENRETIAAVARILTPDYASWDRPSTLPKGITAIYFGASRTKGVTIRLGENYAVCGRYLKALSTDKVSEIRGLLTANGRVVSERDIE